MSSETLNVILAIVSGLFIIIGWFAALTLKDIKADLKAIKNESQQMLMVMITPPGASTAQYTSKTDLTGLTFTNTNIIKVTGTAAGGTGGF